MPAAGSLSQIALVFLRLSAVGFGGHKPTWPSLRTRWSAGESDFGAIAAAAVVLGIAALTSPFRWGVFLAALAATTKGVPVALTIVAAALAGLAFDVLA